MELDEIVAAAEKLQAERDHYKKLYLETLERCRKLELGLVGPKSERVAKEQLPLQMMGMAMGAVGEEAAESEAEPEKQNIRGHERTKPTGRRKLPEHLPRVELTLVPDIVQQEGLENFEIIGQEVSECIESRPQRLVVAATIRPKYVRKNRPRNGQTRIYISEPLALPIAKCLAGPGLLADTIVKRWEDHLPLNRLARVYARDEIDIAKSTMCEWHIGLSKACAPIVDEMRRDALEQPYICVDATGVLVQAKEKCRTGHFWVLVSPKRHAIFAFSNKHDSAAVGELLGDYRGYIVADAAAVYDHLYRKGDAVEVNCWAHCRRYFFKALSSDPDRAAVAIGLIGKLFDVERRVAGDPRKKREQTRKKLSKPIVDQFFEWCDEQADHVLDETPLAKGIRYARNQRVGLQRFLSDGRLPIHNNMSELELRRQAVGRKNWLFVGSEDGAGANVVFVTLLASCRMHDIEPWRYLRDVFCLIPKWPPEKMFELAPMNWAVTSARPDVQEMLDLHPLRVATITPIDD